MAGYSGRPLVEKLGLKTGMNAHLIGAVYQAPPGVTSTANARMDFIHFFTKDRAELEREFPLLAKALTPKGMLWISWPKGASKVKTDVTETIVRAIGLRTGLVDVKVCAVDDVWSGLKFVIRLKDRN